MANVKAKVLQTTAGDYGLARVGEEITLSEKHAQALEKKRVIEIIGKAEGEEQTKEKEGSFTITDNTGKAKEKAETETDESNPTGTKEKNDKAGPKKVIKKKQ